VIRRDRTHYITVIFWVGLILTLSTPGETCTLFGAIGNAVEGGGVLIGKTRDRSEPFEQVFIEIQPKEGFRYRGIATQGRSVSSGINEKGLVVVSGAASNVERKGEKVTPPGKILSRASCVEDVLQMLPKGEIKGPVHFLVADRHKIVLIEAAGKGHYGTEIKESGVLYHTNHFVLESMKKWNPKVGSSSKARYDRIEALMTHGPYTKEAFIAMTRDHEHGPGDLSICRHREEKSRKLDRTISAAVYSLSKGGTPEVWFTLGQPCQSNFEKHESSLTRLRREDRET